MTFKGEKQLFDRPSSPLWQEAVLLSVAYFLCAVVGSSLSARGGIYVSFWLPAGLFVAVLLLNRTADWPVLCLAVLPANLAFDYFHDREPNLVAILLFYLTNVIQSVGGAWLVKRFVAERPTLATIKEFTGLVVFAGVLGTMPGAAIGAATLVKFGLSNNFVESFKVWWGSCTMAVLVVTPLILVFFGTREKLPPESFTIQRIVEALLIF